MKISELSRHTNVPKETIHYYVREGFIPRPRKKGKNVSEYDESLVERISLLKQIQDHFFLPLSIIKQIMKRQDKSSELKALLKLRMGYFNPLDQLLEKEVVGVQAFAKTTGMGKKWISKFEEWGAITPETHDGKRIYSQDDVIIGKLLVDLDRVGFGPKDGFDPGNVRRYIEIYGKIVRLAREDILDSNWTCPPRPWRIAHQLKALGVGQVAGLMTWDQQRACADIAAGLADAVYVVQPPATNPTRLGIAMEADADGVRIVSVVKDSVAEQAGLKATDVVVEIAGRPVRSVQDVRGAVQRQAPGTWLPLKVKRGDQTLEVIARFPAGT